MNKKHKKWGHPLSSLVIGDNNSASVYKSSKTWLITNWNRTLYCKTNNPEESKEKW